jgi:nucleotide-binding universal stress UspA family protein
MSLEKPLNIVCSDFYNCDVIKGAPMRHILVPFDDARHATKAFSLALTLAKTFGAWITAASVVQEDIKNSWISGTPGREKGMSERSVTRLDDKMKLLQLQAQKFGVKFDSVIMTSSTVAETMLSFIREYNIDFIVMGSRGKGMLKEMMLGRVSTNVALNSPCPVLIVK